MTYNHKYTIISTIALLPEWMPNTQEDAHELFVAMTTRLSYELPSETGYSNYATATNIGITKYSIID